MTQPDPADPPVAAPAVPVVTQKAGRLERARHWLLDAKKALASAAGFATTAVALGFVSSAQAAEITGGIGVATTVLVYLADNLT